MDTWRWRRRGESVEAGEFMWRWKQGGGSGGVVGGSESNEVSWNIEVMSGGGGGRWRVGVERVAGRVRIEKEHVRRGGVGASIGVGDVGSGAAAAAGVEKVKCVEAISRRGLDL